MLAIGSSTPALARARSWRARVVRQSVIPSVGAFAVTGLVAVAIVGWAGVRILQGVGEHEAIRDAVNETRLAGAGIVAPALVAPVLGRAGVNASLLDRVIARRVARGPVVRIKLWDAGGRIVYSDDRRLVGTRYRLAREELAALVAGRAAAEVSDLGKPENRDERRYGKLLEVYQGIRTPTGRRLLWEEYLNYTSVAASGRRLWNAFAPALLVTVALLELAQIPLAWQLASRLRRRQAEREGLLRQTIDASQTERRRIARELHDGPVQDLAGVAYALAATGVRLGAKGDAEAAAEVDRTAADARGLVRALRSLLVDIYPPTLESARVDVALADLAAGARAHGLHVEIDAGVEQLDGLSTAHAAVLIDSAQEAVRNAVRHAAATTVTIRAGRGSRTVYVECSDDGVGFPAAHPDRVAGHFGLRLTDDRVRAAGGRLTVCSAPGAGTTIRVELPVS